MLPAQSVECRTQGSVRILGFASDFNHTVLESPTASMSVEIRFVPDNVTITAEVGEPLLSVAERAGVSIPTGCLMGSCHACEVELEDGQNEGQIICSCISAVPPGKPKLTVNLFVDPTW